MMRAARGQRAPRFASGPPTHEAPRSVRRLGPVAERPNRGPTVIATTLADDAAAREFVEGPNPMRVLPALVSPPSPANVAASAAALHDRTRRCPASDC